MHTPTQMLFPPEPRHFPGQRWVNISLRSAHLVGVAGMGGDFLFAVEEARWLPFGYLTLASGLALTLLYVGSTARWLLKLTGQAILFKTVLLAVAVARPDWGAELFVLVIVISGLIAHAPSRVREWCWWSPELSGSDSVSSSCRVGVKDKLVH